MDDVLQTNNPHWHVRFTHALNLIGCLYAQKNSEYLGPDRV